MILEVTLVVGLLGTEEALEELLEDLEVALLVSEEVFIVLGGFWGD